jgi:hypothetical protein
MCLKDMGRDVSRFRFGLGGIGVKVATFTSGWVLSLPSLENNVRV